MPFFFVPSIKFPFNGEICYNAPRFVMGLEPVFYLWARKWMW